MGIIVSHCNDPQQPTSVMKSKAGFFFVAHLESKLPHLFHQFFIHTIPNFPAVQVQLPQKKATVKNTSHTLVQDGNMSLFYPARVKHLKLLPVVSFLLFHSENCI